MCQNASGNVNELTFSISFATSFRSITSQRSIRYMQSCLCHTQKSLNYQHELHSVAADVSIRAILLYLDVKRLDPFHLLRANFASNFLKEII